MIKHIFLTIFLLVVSAAAIPAQNNVEQSIKNARDQFSDIKTRSVEIERMKRDANKKATNDVSTAKFSEIKKDFEQIQKINMDLVQMTAAKSPVNYAAALNFVSEINRRAARLNSNLFPAEDKQKKDAGKKQLVVESQDLKALFDALDKSINSFAHNPIFQNINFVNLHDSLTAQNDLEAVIKISFSIKEKVKNLSNGVSKK